MPRSGTKQTQAGVELNTATPILGGRKMISRNSTINSALSIDNCEYKGNAVLNANR